MRRLFFTVVSFWTVLAYGQESIPLGTWRNHISYNKLIDLAVSPTQIFAASDNGVMVLDKSAKQITTISKSNGLGNSIVTSIGYNHKLNLLLIGYADGLIDLVVDNEITEFNRIATSSAISGSRRINSILVQNDIVYMSADFGVIVFDPNRLEVKETYRDLGENGETLKIFKSVVFNDSLFLATENGVIAGALEGSNLLDFRSWKRYNQGDLNAPVQSIAALGERLFAAINMQGIYSLSDGIWTKESFLQSQVLNQMEGSMDHLLIAAPDKVWLFDGTELTSIDVVSGCNDVAKEIDGTVWIASEENGLLSFRSENASVYKPNGPSSNQPWNLIYDGQRMVNLKGGYSIAGSPLNRKPKNDQFEKGQWSTTSTQLTGDITDYARIGDVTYYSSFGGGLEKTERSGTTVFTELNSPLAKPISSTGVLIPSIASSADGLWVANFNTTLSLHLLKPEATWESFSIPFSQAQFPLELLTDASGHVWMRIDPARGGGIVVFDKASLKSVYLTTQAGKGGLPSNSVLSLANDRDGQVWVGTDEGVAYFPSPTNIFESSVDAVRPIFDNRFLLRDENVTAIAVDGGNRKWMGTNTGAWLFDPSGEKLIYNFTAEDSPIISNKVTDIEIDPESGEVFFATDKGVSSFRSDATASRNQFEDVKIFPNPVSAQFNGLVAINGLYTDALVKITDISGRLVWQTRANGGTASWNTRQLNGDRVGTGMYLVFATSEDGAERHVGKIAVIE